MALQVPISWLKDFVAITHSIEELAERLTIAGLEVETIATPGSHWDDEHLFVAQITDVQPHINAEKLALATVCYGDNKVITVITGAPNIKAYENNLPAQPLKVPLALPGALLVDPKDGLTTYRLKPTSIRDIRSEGMICSELEIGLGDRHEGVLLLPEDAPVGVSFKQYMKDAVIHFDIKGGFSHLLSIWGIAREIAALTNVKLDKSILPEAVPKEVQVMEQPPFVRLEIQQPELCPRYTALLIRNVKVAPSPFWIQQRLLRCGMRPINNIVDITNYVMLELGQPLHAFDYQALRQRAGGKIPTIIVRLAQEGETIKTLDQIERTLDAQMLLIADTQGPLALAGVMGGKETEVTNKTTDILLESANFEFLNNRRTSQLLKLRTEASERFGKRMDPDLPLQAAMRVAQLLTEYAGGVVEPIYGDLYLQKKEAAIIRLDAQSIYRILGIEIPEKEVIRILEALEFQVTPGDPLQVRVPGHRMDVQVTADLIEELVRVYGYNHLPATLLNDELPPQNKNHRLVNSEKIRDILIAEGLDEIITYSIIDIRNQARLSPDDVHQFQFVSIRNPLSQERAHLRRSLLPGALETAQHNFRFTERIAIFEIGAVFHPQENQVLPNEPLFLSVLLTGRRMVESWLEKNSENMDFYDLKGVAQTLFTALHLQDVVWKKDDLLPFHPGRCAKMIANGIPLGYLGELHPRIQREHGFPEQPVCILEINLDQLFQCWNDHYRMAPLSSYAPIYEDLAFVVDTQIPAELVTTLIMRVGKPLLQRIKLFDVFTGEQVGKGKKSLAYALTYQSFEKTLTDKEVEPIREKIIERLQKELNASLRA